MPAIIVVGNETYSSTLIYISISIYEYLRKTSINAEQYSVWETMPNFKF